MIGSPRTFPAAYTWEAFPEEVREFMEQARGRKVQGGDWTYPACLAEPTLKERMEGHGVFPTTGQTAICKKDKATAKALGLTVPYSMLGLCNHLSLEPSSIPHGEG